VTQDAELLLAPLVAAAAAGRRDALVAAARAARDAGIPGEIVRESLLTLVPFCGYPRTLDALSDVRPILGAAVAQDVSAATPDRGRALFDRVYGPDAARVRANLGEVDAEVLAWIERDAYGKVLARPGISASLRERIGVVLLAAQGLRRQLPGHVRGALRCGATAADVRAFLIAAGPLLPPAELAFALASVPDG
jgi:alkylhydroperoxidase/carboxymuconolactone decarboxylase family protein YurZ